MKEGRDLKTPHEIKKAKQKLLKRVGHISDWDVSRVTDMRNLFEEQSYLMMISLNGMCPK